MLVPPSFRKSVAFLFAGDRVIGTAWNIYVPATEDPSEGGGVFLATAGHVIDMGSGVGDDLTVRFNTKDGESIFVPSEWEDWKVSDDADVAVAPSGYDEALGLDIYPIPIDRLISDSRKIELEVAEGDEAFFVGLFVPLKGADRNLPVARFGHVALMPQPGDPVELETLDKMTGQSFSRTAPAYLVEVYSRGGHSGSPAFLYLPVERHPGRMTGLAAPQGPVGIAGVLGIVSGHFDDDEVIAPSGGKVNSGIAVVTPAQHIIDIITGEERFVRMMDRLRKQVEPA